MTLGMNKHPIDIQLRLLKMLTGCLEIAFLNVMGFGSFNHVMNIYFFSIYLLLVEIEWWTFPPMALSMFIFSLLQSAFVIWQCKTSYVRIDIEKQSFFQRIFICHHHLHSDAEWGVTEWLVLSTFWYIFLWMAAPANTIFKIKYKTVIISNGSV